MEELVVETKNLKDKILNEIESISMYEELNHLKEGLLNKLNGYEYDPSNKLSLLKYREFLDMFLNIDIKLINNKITKDKELSVYDNREASDINTEKELEEEINKDIELIANAFDCLGEELRAEFDSKKEYFEKAHKDTLSSSKRNSDVELHISDKPILSLYPDTKKLSEIYSDNLRAFINEKIAPVKKLVDNDTKVKEVFKRAYETLTDPKVIEAIKKLEDNYNSSIARCLDHRDSSEFNIERVQKVMMENGVQLDSLVEKTKEEVIMCEKINTMTFNTDLNTVKDIEEFVERTGLFADLFYNNLYAIIEKDKFLRKYRDNKSEYYELLSDKSKNELDKIFIERVSCENDDELKDTIYRFKKDGYVNVLDKEFESFFKHSYFRENSSYKLNKFDDYREGDYSEKPFRIIENSNKNKRNYIMVFDDKQKKPVKLGERVENSKVYGNIIEVLMYRNDCKKYSIPCGIHIGMNSGEKRDDFGDNHYDIVINDYYNGLYVVSGIDKKGKVENRERHVAFYDSNFFIIDCQYGYKKNIFIDHTNDKAWLLDFDNPGNLIRYDINGSKARRDMHKNVLDYKELFESEQLKDYTIVPQRGFTSVNNGVLVAYFKDKSGRSTKLGIIDLENGRLIDFFDVDWLEKVVYNDGLYRFYDKESKRYGYKDINGNVMYPAVYTMADNFVNGIAYVSNEATSGFLTKGSGVNNDIGFVIDFNLIHPDIDQKKIFYSNPKRRESGEIVRSSNYYLCDERPIMEIESPAKARVLKRLY